MRALVVYESMFGNTKTVALAIAEGIGRSMQVEAVEVGEAPSVVSAEVGLLVVGSPTHAHGMSTPKTRADAAERAGSRLVSRGTGLHEWLDGLPAPATPIAAAAFDTRIKGPELIWGSAAKGAAKQLGAHGFRLVTPARSFLVAGPTGPSFDRVEPEQLAAARSWGEELAGTVSAGLVGAAR